MANDINRLFSALQKSQESILTVINDLDTLAKEAVGFNGNIAKTVPLNLKAAMDQLMQVANGTGQSSLSNLIEYIDNIPISEIRKTSITKTVVDDRGAKNIGTAAEAPGAGGGGIDTTPNTAGGAKSAIAAHESVDLNAFLKQNYGKKSYKQLKEDNELSFDAITHSSEFDAGDDFSEILPGDIETDPAFGMIDSADDYDDDHNEEDLYGEAFDSDEDFSEYEDELTSEELITDEDFDNDPGVDETFITGHDDFSEILPGGLNESRNWRKIYESVHPEDRNIETILNDNRRPI